MESRMRTAAVLFCLVFPVVRLLSAVPLEFNYQGVLRQYGIPVTGTRDVTFRLYNHPVSGNLVWSQTVHGVQLSSGVFNTILELPANGIDWREGNFWFEVQIDGKTFAPRQKLVSQFYALHSRTSEGMSANSGRAAHVYVGTVEAAVFGESSTTIKGDLIIQGLLSANTVNTAAIQNGAVTGPKIAANAVSSVHIADYGITSVDIATNAVTYTKIAPFAVHGDHIAPDSIGIGHILPNSIDRARIVDGEVRSEDIGEREVKTVNIADGSVTSEKLSDEAVTDRKLAPGISADKITTGQLPLERFSAYWDLDHEGYLDNNNGRDILTRDQADGRYVNHGEEWSVVNEMINSVSASKVTPGTYPQGDYTVQGNITTRRAYINSTADQDDDAHLMVRGHVKMLGTPVTGHQLGQTYGPFASDGFFFGYLYASPSGSTGFNIYAGYDNPPQQIRGQTNVRAGEVGSVCIPIRRGEYVRMNAFNYSYVQSHQFMYMPFGGN